MGIISLNIPKVVKVTYLLGNGFDLGLGLRTSYSDFLHTYIVPKPDDTALISRFRRFIKSDLDQLPIPWGDAEKRFGELPFSEFAEKEKLKLADVLVQLDSSFQSELSEYLHIEEMRFKVPELDQEKCRADMLTKMIWLIGHAMGAGGRIDCGTTDVQLNFITLNYTRTLNRFLYVGTKNDDPVILRADDELSKGIIGGPQRVVMGYVCHAHGSLSSLEYRLFGVNDSSQILDDEARSICQREGYLIKTEEDKHADVGHRDEAVKIIDGSDILVLFGLSYGQTDKFWWKTIVAKAEANKSFRVILVPFVPNCSRAVSVVENIQRASAERERFFMGISDDGYDILAKKYEKQFYVLSHGPYDATDKSGVYCDPLYLRDFREKYLMKDLPSEILVSSIEDVKSKQVQLFQEKAIGTWGQARFDYTRNNGQFTIEVLGEIFETRWSVCGSDSVYIYSANSSNIGIREEPYVWPIEQFVIQDFDWTNSHKKIRVNEICVIPNDNKRLLAIRIVSVRNKDYGGSCNELIIDYRLIGD